MNIYKYDIVYQEVPHHISLALYVCGCPLQCPGCHSPELWTEKTGTPLTREGLLSLLNKYCDRISCVLFLGGEWHEQELVSLLQVAREQSLLTALYTGLDVVSPELEKHLDFLKTGPWRRELGGLASPNTNQIFRDLRNGQILNHLFQTNSKETSL
ncbi:anaerobic ribonucleoside-triphosphate reductase activating protein [Bdellovibrio svalbardensis]|uniref:Anaerobic ribonucleoside-triphosphate reductase activating protein n=1 Tax=Bdellovibrio svalbardensis TaxID=2972972 RepID=A0ABT6DJ90_9BACT|nr:anaerobic ribonucleoside-triphosphate reductase activating protein [Bdellovibrio svalbardensis]MDG0816900.1 anaerobic ribonucleoside-triphosphate reductase activating protein [Bdellovibrio svalbardensis]